MESAAVNRSFNCSTFNSLTLHERHGKVSQNNVTFFNNLGKSSSNNPINGLKSVFPSTRRVNIQIACAKASEIKATPKAEDNAQKVATNQNSTWRATFPTGFEELVTGVCDETKIAEVKLKVGDFQMHIKRNLATKVVSSPSPSPSPPPPPPPSKPVSSSPSPPKASTEKVTPFSNISYNKKLTKLASLESSGASGCVFIASPSVGSFRRGRTLKGKKQPPICKQGDAIKEGQVIGYLEQFGSELPVRSNVVGEVLEFLYQDEEAVGYGDPLIAILPSFHSIKGNKL